jgi:hypothetical protein
MKLVEKFNYSNSEKIELNENQKKILDGRRSMDGADNFLTLKEAQKNFKQRYGFKRCSTY